jgi:MFS family permease
MSDSQLRRFAMRLFVDVTPLKQSREYRWLYAGLANAWLGRQLTVVAVPFQVYRQTGSTLAVGLLGAVQLVPLLATSVIGGAMADAVDRRRLLVVSQVALACTAAGLMWNAMLETPMLWPLYVLAGLNAAISAVDSPTRAAVLPMLVRRDLLSSALALNQTLGNVAKAVGPALGGVLISTAGLEWTFGFEMVLFIGGALAMLRIRPLPPAAGGRRVGLSSIVEGWTFLKRRRLLQANFAIDLNATIFGMPRALFPAIGTQVLGGDAVVVGLLYAAPGLGALVGAITSGWIPRVERQGRAVVVAVTVWGAAMAMFGLTSSVLPAVILLGVAGFADVVSAVFRNTILQLSIPDALRGRLSGIHIAVVSGGPRLGDLEAGAVAAITSVRFSVVSGGLACIAGALVIGRYMPELVRYRRGDGIPQTTTEPR